MRRVPAAPKRSYLSGAEKEIFKNMKQNKKKACVFVVFQSLDF